MVQRLYDECYKVHNNIEIVQIRFSGYVMLDCVLRQFRLRSEVYHNARVCGDWVLNEGHPGQTCFHLPTEGACRLLMPGHEPVVLETGDLVIFPRELPHTLLPLHPGEGPQQHLPYQDSSASGTALLCGRILFQHRGFDHILDALPEVFYIPRSQSQSWLEPMLALMLDESYRTRNSSSIVLDRGSELLFILALRHYVEAHPEQVGVLALYSTPRLAAAIEVIHHQPEQKWTLASLARQAGMSRTAFANRFRDVSGWTPMQYLTWWRMQLAWTILQQGTQVAEVAGQVGYQSESAFSRAFQAAFGTSAGRVRQQGGEI
jgi:AraC-like DNA-binding protein